MADTDWLAPKTSVPPNDIDLGFFSGASVGTASFASLDVRAVRLGNLSTPGKGLVEDDDETAMGATAVTRELATTGAVEMIGAVAMAGGEEIGSSDDRSFDSVELEWA